MWSVFILAEWIPGNHLAIHLRYEHIILGHKPIAKWIHMSRVDWTSLSQSMEKIGHQMPGEWIPYSNWDWRC
jgi:hypothetical protein